MPNLASVLKCEVTRLARKELRQGLESLRKALAGRRTEIAALKRRIAELEKQVKDFKKKSGRGGAPRATASADVQAADTALGLRFRAAGVASNRKRLGLSAHDFGMLVGATGQSVYQWEHGNSKPRPQNLTTIAALRGLGKKEVAARLAEIKAGA